jgi:hypothetical protein
MASAFVEYENIIPLLAPQDIASTMTASSYMDLKTAQRAAFLVIFGAVTSASSDVEAVTVESASVETAAEVAIAYNYRLSGALGTNTWGAITAVGATGVAIDPANDDNKMLWIEIDPAAVQAANEGHRFVRVKLTDDTDMGACLVTVIGLIQPRYKQTTMVSATAAASA